MENQEERLGCGEQSKTVDLKGSLPMMLTTPLSLSESLPQQGGIAVQFL
jgi:hypothetical protein